MRPLGGAFGVILGVLGRSWRPLGRLGGVLTASWHGQTGLCLRAGPGLETTWSCGGNYPPLGVLKKLRTKPSDSLQTENRLLPDTMTG